jgi:fatty-acyl-CoA synthase
MLPDTLPEELHRAPVGFEGVLRALDRYADRPCLDMDGQVITYAQVRDRASQLAQALQAADVQRGQPVARLLGNTPDVLILHLASGALGVRGTALNAMSSVDDLAYILEDAGIEAVVFQPGPFDDTVAQLREKVPAVERWLALGPTSVGEDLAERAAQLEPQPLEAAQVRGDDLSSIVYTGGTTGRPKGVALPYRTTNELTRIQLAEWQWPEQVRFLACTPLSHAAGSVLMPTLLRGGSLVVLPRFTPDDFFDAIEQHRITATMLVPTMLYTLLDHPRSSTADLSSLETIYYGAAAMSPTRLAEALDRWGPRFVQFYGQTESPMTICVLRKEDHDPAIDGRLSSCGRPVPWVTTALLDSDNRPVAQGEPGELCVRGPLVMAGYWNKPEETAAALEGGWLHTGDVAVQDEQGFLTIVDRKKDLIITGGFNVYPREVEDVLTTHPAVAAAAVIGVPDDKWGEAVKAVVQLREAAGVAADELIALVRDTKGPVYAPKTVDVVDELPITDVGKPDKQALRARYWEGAARNVN